MKPTTESPSSPRQPEATLPSPPPQVPIPTDSAGSPLASLKWLPGDVADRLASRWLRTAEEVLELAGQPSNRRLLQDYLGLGDEQFLTLLDRLQAARLAAAPEVLCPPPEPPGGFGLSIPGGAKQDTD